MIAIRILDPDRRNPERPLAEVIKTSDWAFVFISHNVDCLSGITPWAYRIYNHDNAQLDALYTEQINHCTIL